MCYLFLHILNIWAQKSYKYRYSIGCDDNSGLQRWPRCYICQHPGCFKLLQKKNNAIFNNHALQLLQQNRTFSTYTGYDRLQQGYKILITTIWFQFASLIWSFVTGFWIILNILIYEEQKLLSVVHLQ